MDDRTWDPVRERLTRRATGEVLRACVHAGPLAAFREAAGGDLPEDGRLIGRVSADGM